MKEIALQKLNLLVSKGILKKTIEDDLDMPKNTVATYLTGARDLPAKWIEPILQYAEKFLGPDAPLAVPDPKTQLVVDVEGIKEKPSEKTIDVLRLTMNKINKDFGAGTVMLLGEKPNIKVDAISTGSISLDAAIGVGGLPRGRIVEIFGPESSGKTTIAIHVIANAQKKGLKCLMVDAEHAFDAEYAENLGVNIEDLLLCQPDNGEEGLEVADRYISSGSVGVAIIDSVAALIPKGELEGEMGDSKMGLHARLMSQACRKMVASIAKTNTLCIFINQLREKIGVMYGPSEVTTGGNALKFYSSVRLDVRRIGQLKDGDEAYGNRTKVRVIKNKVAPPFKSTEFDILYGQGINRIGEILDISVQKNIINKSGSWYSYNDTKLGQGRDAAISILKDNEELLSEIENKIKDPQ